jgi:hypothetical protein
MGISIPPNFKQDIENLGTLCYLCIANAAPEEQQGKELRINCTRCDKPFCDKCASRTDPQFCRMCLTDFQVVQTNQLYNGVEEILIIDPSGERPDTIARIPYKTRFKQIKLMGTDWLFYETAISAMSDSQLEVALQWHKAAVSEIEVEITEHKIRKAQKDALVKIPKVTNIAKKQPDTQKMMSKAAAMLETFAKLYGKDNLAAAMKLMEEKKTS